MHQAMYNQEMKFNGSVEEDFFANMISHHQGAVDSVKSLLKYSKDENIRQIAKQIIADQEKEIAEFRKILQNKSY